MITVNNRWDIPVFSLLGALTLAGLSSAQAAQRENRFFELRTYSRYDLN